MKTHLAVSYIHRIAIAALLATASLSSNAGTATAIPSAKGLGNPLSATAYAPARPSAQVQDSIKKAKTFDDFAEAINRVETNGRQGRIYGDGGRSYGPLQISYATWRDAVGYAPGIGGRYSDCKSFDYSKRVMLAYLEKHSPTLLKNKDWEGCARLWNSGPNWQSKRRLTNSYWAEVKGHLLAKLG